MTALPPIVHEAVVAPVALGLAFRHARRAQGATRAAVELLALTLYGFALERAAMSAFASHDYGAAWRAAPWGVPLAVAAVWAAVIVSAIALAARLRLRSAAARAAAAALIGISLDLLVEPVAVRSGLWHWTPPGPWLQIPLGNFVGWGIIVGVYAFGAELWDAGTDAAGALARRTLLGAVSIAALLGVGAAWRGLGIEALLAGALAWWIWGALLAATIALGLGQRRSPAVATGREPAWVFVLLGGTFAVDALLLGDGALVPVVVGTALALVVVMRG